MVFKPVPVSAFVLTWPLLFKPRSTQRLRAGHSFCGLSLCKCVSAPLLIFLALDHAFSSVRARSALLPWLVRVAFIGGYLAWRWEQSLLLVLGFGELLEAAWFHLSAASWVATDWAGRAGKCDC